MSPKRCLITFFPLITFSRVPATCLPFGILSNISASMLTTTAPQIFEILDPSSLSHLWNILQWFPLLVSLLLAFVNTDVQLPLFTLRIFLTKPSKVPLSSTSHRSTLVPTHQHHRPLCPPLSCLPDTPARKVVPPVTA